MGKIRWFKHGEEFEKYFCGELEPLSFPISFTSFNANLANAILAQPKGHDPRCPIGKPLKMVYDEIIKCVPCEWQEYIQVYVCIGLPVDVLNGMDIVIACMHPQVYAMGTIDLTINSSKITGQDFKSDFLVMPADCRKWRLVVLARSFAHFLSTHQMNIPQEVISMVESHKIRGRQGSG
jgi:hypothetical protein